ncbi:1983_t:CDS:2, partial [Racocetra fulgida]
ESEFLTETDQVESKLIDKEPFNEETSTSDEIASSSQNNTKKLRKKALYATNRAPVRDFLWETDDGGNICQLCKQPFGSQTAISTINRHFETFHPSEFSLIRQPDAMIELLKEMNIGQKLLGITTDNAANMIAMGRVLKIKMDYEFNNNNVQHFRCGAHVLNIIVEEGIKLVKINTQHAVANSMRVKATSYWAHLNESSTISGLLDPCNKLSTYEINEREQAINKLHEIYKNYKPAEENKPSPPLPLSTTTIKSTRELF